MKGQGEELITSGRQDQKNKQPKSERLFEFGKITEVNSQNTLTKSIELERKTIKRG